MKRLSRQTRPQKTGAEEQRGILTSVRVPVKSKKLRLSDIRDRQYFDLVVLAEQAGVDTSVIHRVLNGQPVQRYQAELLLSSLADVFSEDYTLETVDILLFPEDQGEES